MKSEMASRLKEVLAQTTQDQFNKEWSEIEALGFSGPSGDELLEYYSVNQNITGDYEIVQENASSDYSETHQLTLAA